MIFNRLLCSGVLLALCGYAPVYAQCPGMVFAHLVDGSGWKSSLYLTNGSASSKANYTLTFRGDSGQPVLLSFADGRRDNQISGTIAAGGVAILETTGADADPLFSASATLSITGTITGFAVIREKQAGGPDREATVTLANPAAGGLVFPFDNNGGSLSSIAVSVPCGPATPIVLTASAFDENGVALGQSQLKSMAGGHLAFITTDQLPGSKGKRGIIRITGASSVYLSGVGLRFTPAGALTTFPPTPWSPAAAAHAVARPVYRKRR